MTREQINENLIKPLKDKGVITEALTGADLLPSSVIYKKGSSYIELGKNRDTDYITIATLHASFRVSLDEIFSVAFYIGVVHINLMNSGVVNIVL